MAKTFSTMKTNVGNFVMDTTSTMATLIGVWLNDKYLDIWRRHPWSVSIDFDYTFPTVASTATYSLPATFDSEIFVANITDGTIITRYTEGQWMQERYSAYSGGSIQEGSPSRYIILREASVVKLDPTPSAVKTIAFPFKKIFTALVDSGNTTSILDIENIMEYGAIAEAEAFNKQFAKADYYFQKYEEALAKRIGQEKAMPNQLNQRIIDINKMAIPKRLTGEIPYA